MKPQVLIANKVFPSLDLGLEELGYNVIYKPDIEYDDLYRMLPQLEGVIVNTRNPMYKEAIDKGVNLKFIARLGSGMDIIDVEYAEERGIKVFSAPEGNSNAVAEHALSLLLALFNNIHHANQSVKDFNWAREDNRGRELAGLTVGIIGYGNNGSAFEKKLRSLDVKVRCFDKYKQRYLDSSRCITECSSLESVIKNSDVISLHIPLTDETRKMVDNDFLEKCKDNVTLINTSRGDVVDLNALLHHFENGKLYGACLDVLPNEDMDSLSAKEKEILERLMKFNTIFTPHIAGWTVESYKKISEVLLRKLRQWLNNQNEE